MRVWRGGTERRRSDGDQKLCIKEKGGAVYGLYLEPDH